MADHRCSYGVEGCGAKVPNVQTWFCMGCRLDALEKDSHPPKPTLDPDSFEQWQNALIRRIDTIEDRIAETERKIRAIENAQGEVY